ncbi:MAG: efflux transporter periplasmic adaptor subunit [Stappia sp.]|uniref:HlyD family secretion protein n=1 Tax=Stappia sp. TaxID=1870903 RepID=UPI000C6A3D0F|nr:HlyD family efflux transporter periplasmic adaptor subunit [Stappia sp.]MAA96717.1 efflux transporter periplasmic adaptor subunit [Stappia sp.]MBM21835.1 efflux transporter periplasmic adaptor subunit [Stappia sp.]
MSKGKLLVAVLVVLVLGAGGYSVWQRLAEPELPAGIVSANGRIEAERIDVSSKIAGRVADVLVREGDWVEAGALVARLDTTEIEAQLHQAEAQVNQAEQQKLQSQALLNQRKSELAYAEQEFRRAEQLSERGHTTVQQVDNQRMVLATARASVTAAEAGIGLANATIASATASVERLRSVINDAELVAPRSGRVQYVLANAGEVVGAGGKVVTLTDLTDVYMTVFLRAADAGRLAIGAEARLVLDPVPQYVVPARVTFVASTAQFTPKTVETSDERAKLMFRVRLGLPQDLLKTYQEQAKAGVAGMGYVRVDPSATWPDWLKVKLPQ